MVSMDGMFRALVCAPVLGLFALSGCTTTAAKKAMAKPLPKDGYSGFDEGKGKVNKREAETLKPVTQDTDPDVAVSQLVEQLQKNRSYSVQAEEQLKVWGTKQGVDQIVVSKVRLLMKHQSVEVRAPAVRLTVLYGRADSNGDLIECLADSEFGIRETAYKALRTRAHRDFGYSPGAGEVARADAVDKWRQWWQLEQRKGAVQPPSVYEQNPPTEPQIVSPKKR